MCGCRLCTGHDWIHYGHKRQRAAWTRMEADFRKWAAEDRDTIDPYINTRDTYWW
jgi:hypothetical protein